jgi:hypothetical protein
VRAWIDATVELFTRACASQRRCRDDERGQERATRALVELADQIKHLPDDELSATAAAVEMTEPNLGLFALIPRDGSLLPPALPWTPLPRLRCAALLGLQSGSLGRRRARPSHGGRRRRASPDAFKGAAWRIDFRGLDCANVRRHAELSSAAHPTDTRVRRS